MTRLPGIIFDLDDTALLDVLFISSGTLEVFHSYAAGEYAPFAMPSVFPVRKTEQSLIRKIF